MRTNNRALGNAVIDLLGNLFLVMLVMVAPTKSPPHIETFGQYAVTMDWPGDSKDDVDLYVQDPLGNIVYYAAVNSGAMNLEHDNIPKSTEQGIEQDMRRERVILRAYETGEYIINVHMYSKNDKKSPVPVKVSLVRLRGEDITLRTQQIQLVEDGEETTAFRFRLDARGNLKDVSHLPKKLANGVSTEDSGSIGGGGIQTTDVPVSDYDPSIPYHPQTPTSGRMTP